MKVRVLGSLFSRLYSSKLFPEGVTTKRLSPFSLDQLLATLCILLEAGMCDHQTCILFLVTSYLIELIHRFIKCDLRSYDEDCGPSLDIPLLPAIVSS